MRETKTIKGIKIERNIPIPEIQRSKSNWIEIFDQMEVGDSFLLNANIRSSVQERARIQGIILTIRMTDDPKVVRVWKVK